MHETQGVCYHRAYFCNLIPGAGEANFDSSEKDFFVSEGPKAGREHEVDEVPFKVPRPARGRALIYSPTE